MATPNDEAHWCDREWPDSQSWDSQPASRSSGETTDSSWQSWQSCQDEGPASQQSTRASRGKRRNQQKVPKVFGKTDFGGGVVNFLQIGLGTNTTFLQNLAGKQEDWSSCVDWMMQAASEWRPSRIRAVGVEPVPHLAKYYETQAAELRNVALVQVAIGEQDVDGTEEHILEEHELLSKVPPDEREALDDDLVYLRNMSCVGGVHPGFTASQQKICERYGVTVELNTQTVDVWTFGRLARTLNFKGIEVLMIDAEGYDVHILRSMMEHCRDQPKAWPHLIMFETMGHCDNIVGEWAEWNIVHDLEQAGYMLIYYSWHNTFMMHKGAYEEKEYLTKWADYWVCCSCRKRRRFPYNTVWVTKCCRCRARDTARARRRWNWSSSSFAPETQEQA